MFKLAIHNSTARNSHISIHILVNFGYQPGIYRSKGCDETNVVYLLLLLLLFVAFGSSKFDR